MSRSFKNLIFIVLGLVVTAFTVGTAAPAARATTTPTTFSGRATVLQGDVAGVAIPCLASVNNRGLLPTPRSAQCQGVGDTGDISASGGNLDTSLLCYPASNDPSCLLTLPDLTDGMVRAQFLHAAVVSHGKRSAAETYVANFGVNAAGQVVTAEALQAQASATCNNGSVSVSASSQILNLNVNGTPIVLKTDPNGVVLPNQTLPLGTVGTVTVNEQSATPPQPNGDQGIMVNALHIRIPAVVVGGITTVPASDVIVGQAVADIACGSSFPDCPSGHVFVTGGGWLAYPTPSDKSHFTVAGRNGEAWGHVMWSPTGLHVKNPYALAFYQPNQLGSLISYLGANARAFRFANDNLTRLAGEKGFDGAAILYWTQDGTKDGVKIGEALAIDNGEPGRDDFFEIAGIDSTGLLTSIGGGFLQGGNIQMHGKC